jgi:protoheme IX farnesyltransferase
MKAVSVGQVRGGLAARLGAGWRLAKGGLSLMLGLTSLLGFLLASPPVPSSLLLVGGVVLLAGGAASLNSLQEWRQDCLLRRTMHRPLPRGELVPAQALVQAVLLMSCGLLLLATFPGSLPVSLGLLAVVLYNGLYTPLKSRSMLALVPGAVCGSLPVVIGWVAGGGRPGSPMTALLMALLVLWQIPHFWLLSLSYYDDYAGGALPHLLRHLSESAVRRLLVPWVAALAAVMLLFTLLPLDIDGVFRDVTFVIAATLVPVFIFQALRRSSPDYRTLFIFLNLTFFFFIFVVCAARISLDPGAGR